MLFQFPDSGRNAGKLVAYLINARDFTGFARGPQPGSKRAQPHPHDHNAEVQIMTGGDRETDLVPRILNRGATLDIVVPGEKRVTRSDSFKNHVPDLEDIIAKATTPASRGEPNNRLIQNIVTVDRGLVRVTEVTGWDQGGYPLSGNPAEVGVLATSHAVGKFMGSSVQGHLATEVVVEIDDAQDVVLECDHDKRFNVRKSGSDNPGHPNVRPRTVEILIKNYENPGEKPTPWGLDFQWLFELAGYNAVDLAGPEFEAWVAAGQRYDRDLFDAEREMFLDGDGHTFGRPFPYVESTGSLTTLKPLTNLNIWVCIFGVFYNNTVVFAIVPTGSL